MENIDKNIGLFNPSGYKKIQVVPVDDVVSVEFVNALSKRLTLRATPSPAGRLAVIQAKNIKLSCEEDGGVNACEISCRFYGNNLEYYFEAMKRKRYIVVLTDNNNNNHIVGTKEESFPFSYTRINGPEMDSGNYYELKFSRKITHYPLLLIE